MHLCLVCSCPHAHTKWTKANMLKIKLLVHQPIEINNVTFYLLHKGIFDVISLLRSKMWHLIFKIKWSHILRSVSLLFYMDRCAYFMIYELSDHWAKYISSHIGWKERLSAKWYTCWGFPGSVLPELTSFSIDRIDKIHASCGLQICKKSNILHRSNLFNQILPPKKVCKSGQI